jgi:hypothetical protein
MVIALTGKVGEIRVVEGHETTRSFNSVSVITDEYIVTYNVVDLYSVNPDIAVGSQVIAGQTLGYAIPVSAEDTWHSTHWEFGLHTKVPNPKPNAEGITALYQTERHCPLPYFTQSEEERLLRLWDKAAYANRDQFPDLCNAHYKLPGGFSGKSEAVGNDAETPKQGNTRGEKGSQNGDGHPPALIKSLGYDFSTGVVPVLIIDYGTLTHVDSSHPEYTLQPTFVLPAGTKVTAIIDGVVCMIPKLYSGDYSVMMAPSCDNLNYMWEMEHVINVIVEVGDRVKAGQTVAEVSNYSYEYGDPQGLNQSRPDRKYGFDLVEIGLLEGGNAPLHHCPWLYIDPSYKKELLEMMAEARKSIKTETAGTPKSEFILNFLKNHITDWETPEGKPQYNTTDYQAPSCKFTNIIGEDGMPVPA